MLEGLVQNDHQLTLRHILDRMRMIYGSSEIVTLTDDGSERATYTEVTKRVDRLAHALKGLGVEESDRVATFAWNTQRHLEIYLAVPSIGAVLHTLNIRLFAEQLVYIANHAEDKIVFVDDSLVPLLEKVAADVRDRRDLRGHGRRRRGRRCPGRCFATRSCSRTRPTSRSTTPSSTSARPPALCYTSGTTGNPKGVLYSHKSSVLHSFGACLADSMGLSANDRVLPIVPMFHANAWGIPYAAGLVGATSSCPTSSCRPSRSPRRSRPRRSR